MSKVDLKELIKFLGNEDFRDNFEGKDLIDYLNKQFEVKVRPDSSFAKHMERKKIRLKRRKMDLCVMCGVEHCNCVGLFDKPKKREPKKIRKRKLRNRIRRRRD